MDPGFINVDWKPKVTGTIQDCGELASAGMLGAEFAGAHWESGATGTAWGSSS